METKEIEVRFLEIDKAALKQVAQDLGLDWKQAVFDHAGAILNKYGIPAANLKYFTFDRYE